MVLLEKLSVDVSVFVKYLWNWLKRIQIFWNVVYFKKGSQTKPL